MYEREKKQIISCALEMKKNGLIVLNGGNISIRMPNEQFLVTPSNMSYETMVSSDIVLINARGETIEGTRRPSSDSSALLYIFKNMPKVDAIIHTHQPYATALSLIANKLPLCTTNLIDELHDTIKVAPFTKSSDEGMGISTVQYAGNSLAVILKHHGVMTYGKDLNQALSAAIYLEEGCKTYLAALSSGRPISILSEEQITEESTPRGFYGQPDLK